MKIAINIDGKYLKHVDVPSGLSNKQEYDFLYAALCNDIDVRNSIKGKFFTNVIHIPRRIVDLITKES